MLNILIDPSVERRIVDFRLLGMHDIMTLGCYRYAQAHRPLKRHTHGDMFEICLLDEGVQPYIVEGKEYIMHGGDVLVTFPKERHGTGHNPENRGRLYWLLIRKPDSRERFLDLPLQKGRQLVQALLNLSPRTFHGRPSLKGCLDNMFAAYACTSDPFQSIEIRNWALRFLLDLLHSSRERKCMVTPVMQNILRIIEERLFEEKMQMVELAEVAGLSESRFKQRFKEEVGIAPGNYIIQRKVKKAEELLRTTAVTITELAHNLGFSSSQYFATVFRRYTGISPSACKKQNGRKCP